MRRRFDWRYVAGAALVAAVAAIILAVFSLLGRTELEDLYLADSADERFGWRYELLTDEGVQAYEPQFAAIKYAPDLPEGTRAVRITRKMTEEIAEAELEWHPYLDGVEVFLDGELLHGDFPPDARRGDDGFLRVSEADWERLHRMQGDTWRRVRISLPADYLGKELSVTTYFPEEWGVRVPEYPFLGSEDSSVASYIVYSVRFDAAITVYALLALLIAIMFLLDIPNDGADAKTALLCLYFLLLFLNATNYSYAGYYSGLAARLRLDFLNCLYMAPLYLYLALRLKSRWKYPLCAAVAAWALYEGVREYSSVRDGVAFRIGPEALAVLLAVAVAFCVDSVRRERRGRLRGRSAALYGVAAAAVAFVQVFDRVRAWGSLSRYLTDGVLTSLRMGNCEPVVTLVTDIISTLALVVVVMEFVRRTMRTRREVSVLEERARQTMEGYNRLLAAEGATNALHHEMRHHMIALSGILQSGDIERAVRYADAVAGDLDRLPAGRYSQNLLVDVVAGSFLDRAWARQIQVEHQLNVPPELNIADEDLCIFLSNMLQNALEACERMDEGAQRYIRVEMRLRKKFLFIRCVNSAAEEDAQRGERPGHGYGLAAMRKVAEKYNSALVIERAAGEFSVMSDLCLRER